MGVRGWKPVSHFARDFVFASVVAAIAFGIQQLPDNQFLIANPTGVSRGAILMAVGAISGTLTGTSVLTMTIVVGWWKLGRLSFVTSMVAHGDTLLLLLKATTWMLGILAILSICLAALPLTPKAEVFIIPLYVAVVATTVNYFRRSITVLFGAAALVTITVDD